MRTEIFQVKSPERPFRNNFICSPIRLVKALLEDVVDSLSLDHATDHSVFGEYVMNQQDILYLFLLFQLSHIRQKKSGVCHGKHHVTILHILQSNLIKLFTGRDKAYQSFGNVILIQLRDIHSEDVDPGKIFVHNLRNAIRVTFVVGISADDIHFIF